MYVNSGNSCTCEGSVDKPTAIALTYDLHLHLFLLGNFFGRSLLSSSHQTSLTGSGAPADLSLSLVLRMLIGKDLGIPDYPIVIVMKILHVLIEISTHILVHECGIICLCRKGTQQ